MPVHEIGQLKRKGSLGSPYSVKDYYSMNPEFGGLDDRCWTAATRSTPTAKLARCTGAPPVWGRFLAACKWPGTARPAADGYRALQHPPAVGLGGASTAGLGFRAHPVLYPGEGDESEDGR